MGQTWGSISYRVAVKRLLSKIYTHVRGCVIAKRLRILKNAEIGVQYFWIIYLFCNRHSALSSTGWLLLYTSYYYIYLYINVRGCVSAKRLGLSIFFVTDILLYLLQGGRKTAFIENIYTCSRLRERQTASNIEKR